MRFHRHLEGHDQPHVRLLKLRVTVDGRLPVVNRRVVVAGLKGGKLEDARVIDNCPANVLDYRDGRLKLDRNWWPYFEVCHRAVAEQLALLGLAHVGLCGHAPCPESKGSV